MAALLPVFYVAGFFFEGATSAVFLLSIAALAIRRRRRFFVASIAVLSKVIICAGVIVGVAYLGEIFLARYGANKFERYAFFHQRFSLYGFAYWYWLTVFDHVIAPQLFWLRRVRKNAWLCLAVSGVIILPPGIEHLITLPERLSKLLPGLR
jgi:molybdopterin-containing oxidoreductase family membrane subunit